MRPINLLIVDDSQLHLEGVKLVLKSYKHIKVIAEANTTAAALTALTQQAPDVALLDISIESENDGIALAHKIALNYPAVKTIFLTHYKDAKYLWSALQAGAAAFLPKDVTPEEMANAIDTVSTGRGIYLGDTIPLNNIAEALALEKKVSLPKINDLTPREVDIVKGLADGLSTKELAVRFGIEPNTVESHKERIREKLGVKTIVQMIIVALKKGIISLDSI